MAWMLDTNICICLIKQKPVSVLNRFKAILPGDVALSSITVAELEYGVKKSLAIQKNLAALELFLLPFDILSFDYKASQEYGDIRAQLQAAGTPIGPLDTLIAAHAKSLAYTLVTNNKKEFARVRDLKIENWI